MSVRLALLLIAAAALASACRPMSTRDVAGARVEHNPAPKTEKFLEKVNGVQPGTPRNVVRKELGDPDELRQGMVDLRPEPGPTDTLRDFAPAGTRYEQWVYKRGDSHFHVFFTRGTRGDDGVEWEVLTVRSVPRDAVD